MSRAPYSGMEDSAEVERLRENPETPARSRSANTPEKAIKSAVDPAVQVAETTSRRTLIGVIITAVLAAVATIAAAGINKCANPPQPGPSSQTTDKTTDLSGTVRDSNDNPIQGAQVTLDDLPGMRPVETESYGQFTLKAVPIKGGETVTIRVVKEGYKTYTEYVVLGRTPPRIILERRR